MKTVDGVPQFVAFGNIEAATVNKLLMDWAAGRKCVNCEFLTDPYDLDLKYCHKVLREYMNDFDPKTFSCNAFTPKNQENL